MSTLTTSLDGTNTIARELDTLNSLQVVVEGLALVDARFRAIPSLQEIIVEVYEGGISVDIRKIMESHGWTIKVMEQRKEADF